MASGPACQVSSPPATSSSVSAVVARRDRASEATMPGAPWHHCVRGVLDLPARGSSDRRPLGEAVLALGVLRQRRDGPPLELGAALGVEQAAARERVDVAREAVRRAEDVAGLP